MSSKNLHTKTRNRLARQDALREYMQERGSVQYLFDIIEKIEKLDPESETFSQDLAKYSKVVDVRHKMLGKYLPELKATEITGEGGGDLQITVSDFKNA
jgi:ATP-dependent exoDNAse (exonuclease V) alpha subunit